METEMKDIMKRVKNRMAELGMTQEQVAKEMNLTRSQITHYLNGRRNPPFEQLLKLAKILDFQLNELTYGELTTNSLNQSDLNASIMVPRLPILTNSDIREWLNHPKLTEKYQLLQMPPDLAANISDKAFWLRYTGSSMTNPHGTHNGLKPGQMLLVDPEKVGEVKPGNLVVAQFAEDDIRIRQYQLDGKDVFLKAFDPQIPITKMTSDIKLLGLIIGFVHFESAL